MMKKRWISLLVENEIGVLARISSLFASKSYNLDSLSVGTTEDISISRMTIGLTSDDQTFEQIKKQLNRCIEVIKVIDLSDVPMHRKELMFVKIYDCSSSDMFKVLHIKDIFEAKLIDYDKTTILLECVQNESRNHDFIKLLEAEFPNRIEIIRGGSAAIEAISICNK